MRDGLRPCDHRIIVVLVTQRGVAEIVLALRAKRRTTALTTRSLADELGLETEDLDHALAGQRVPAETANVLQGWLDARP